MIVTLYEYCVNGLSRRFPYKSLSLLVNNHFAQVALDLVRALVLHLDEHLIASTIRISEEKNACLGIVAPNLQPLLHLLFFS
jgi:hypothetical protein